MEVEGSHTTNSNVAQWGYVTLDTTKSENLAQHVGAADEGPQTNSRQLLEAGTVRKEELGVGSYASMGERPGPCKTARCGSRNCIVALPRSTSITSGQVLPCLARGF